MFLEFYGLREQPFGVTADPRFLYLSAGHREALASLVYGIEAGLGFSTLIAEPGMGKTTLLNRMLSHFRSSARTAFIFETQCNTREFRRNLLLELELTGFEDNEDNVAFLNRLKHYLLDQAKNRRRVLIMVDEAQNLDDTVLETIRLLSNFETYRMKLLHIILAGQPQLAAKISRPEMMQLRQRINQVNRLRPLQPEDAVNYIAYRLRLAGYSGDGLFTSDALAGIVSGSRGVPREINRLCFNSMSLGFALQRREIDGEIMREVIADLAFDGEASFPPPLQTLNAGGFELAAQFRTALANLPPSPGSNPAPPMREPAGTSPERVSVHYARRRSFWRAFAQKTVSSRADSEEPTHRSAMPQATTRPRRPRGHSFSHIAGSGDAASAAAVERTSPLKDTTTFSSSSLAEISPPEARLGLELQSNPQPAVIVCLLILALLGLCLLIVSGRHESIRVGSPQSSLLTSSAARLQQAKTGNDPKGASFETDSTAITRPEISPMKTKTPY